MSDFFQNGIITTLHKLPSYSLLKIENSIREISKERKFALLLPSLYSELKGKALPGIVEQLKEADYIHEVVVSLDSASRAEFDHAKEFFKKIPTKTTIIWNDSPQIQAIYKNLKRNGLDPGKKGKGRGVWTGMGYILAKGEVYMVTLHDCDIRTYSRDILARLTYPILSKRLNYDFAKGYYARFADMLHGRAVRLFFSPLLKALKKIFGEREFFDYLESFRYPLSGEVAMTTELTRRVRFSSDWGLEIGLLREIYTNLDLSSICQVDLVDRYDHKHQEFDADNITSGIMRMAIDIARTFFRVLSQDGIIFSSDLIRTLKITYYDYAMEFVEKYKNLALLNNLKYDRNREMIAIEKFTTAFDIAAEEFHKHPLGSHLIPTWGRIDSAMPDLLNTKIPDIVDKLNGR
ncbi:glycosyl transferase [candidate division WOR-3 bacterium]|nr:glycosyl transferase [candidate division WOR-3 bacterium]